jgi:nanoRNase/pAp phosphatase (c-di-AMP/oligoRNAs hydrolase)
MPSDRIARLRAALDHLPQADYLIGEAVRACAEIAADIARGPDRQVQQRTVASNIAHELRMALSVDPSPFRE